MVTIGISSGGQIVMAKSSMKCWPRAPAKGLSLVWKHEIGSGFSELVVVDDKIYTMMAEKTDSMSGTEYLVCFDTATGKERWRSEIDDIFIDADDWGDGPRSTPTVGPDMIYCFSGSGKLVAVKAHDGSHVWTVDFVDTFGSTVPRWGFAASPLLIDNLVFMEVGGLNDQAFAAFDKDTGELAWAKGTAAAAYNSPVSANIDGVDHIFFVNGAMLYAFNPAGDTLWTFQMPLRSPMALPLFIAPNKLFISAANDAGSFIVEIADNQPKQLMTSSQMKNDWSSSSYHEGYIYGFNVATLQCIDAHTGERQWLKRGFGKGSLIMVNDYLIILSDLGKVTLAQATPETYTEIATFDAIEGRSWTAPSYAHGKIYVRNHTHMACLQFIH
jgi:outer membrane protein assembly factor BamB